MNDFGGKIKRLEETCLMAGMLAIGIHTFYIADLFLTPLSTAYAVEKAATLGLRLFFRPSFCSTALQDDAKTRDVAANEYSKAEVSLVCCTPYLHS